MEELVNFPWPEALQFSIGMLGLIAGLALLLNRFPSGRWLGFYLLICMVATLDASLGSHLFVHSRTLWVVVSAYYYYHAFFYQRRRAVLWHLLVPTALLVLELTNLIPLLSSVLIGVGVLFYIYQISKLLWEESRVRGFSYFRQSGNRITWLRNFTGLSTLFVVALFLQLINLYISLLFLLLIAHVVYQLFYESSFLSPIPVANKYQKSTLTPQIKAAILSKIEGVMEAEFYLRDNASLTNLAKELGVTTHHLSQVLNESLQISFQDLVARYRIRKAGQLLRDEVNSQVKIESVAAMVGYNSKSSFNAAFKKRTGLTPSEYREAKHVRSYGETPLSDRKRRSNDDQKFSLNHIFSFKLNQVMLRVTLRNLKKYKLYSALNIVGLALGLAACLLIAAYVHHELSYDRHHPDPDNTYRVALNRIYPDYNKEWAITAPILGPTVTDVLPEIQNYTRVMWDDFMLGKEGEIMTEQRLTAVDSGFFQVFEVKILSGSVTNDFFKQNDAIVLTETAARKYFGEEEAVGELFQMQMPKGDKRLVSVAAVIADPRPNSHFSYQVLGTFEMLQFPSFVMKIWGTWATYTYIRTYPGTNPAELAAKINEVAEDYQSQGVDDFDSWLDAGNKYHYFLQSLASIHLHSNIAEEFEANSSEVLVYFFALVGGFILLMAIVNFVNMATARASYRKLEVGIRKSVGASKKDLMTQFLLESTVISCFAISIALPMTRLLLPYFNQTIGKEISFELFYSPTGVAILLLAPFFLGFLSGFYPAMYLSNFGVTAIFQKLISQRGRENVRHLLVIGQFSIAVVLIVGTITVFRQLHFITNKPLGFDKEQLIKINRLPFFDEKIDLFKEEANKLSGVLGIATSSFPMDGVREGTTIRPENNPEGWVNTNTLSVDEKYVKVTGIQLIAGRDFRREEVETREGIEKVILNVAAAQALGWTPEEAVGKPIYVSDEEYRQVIGVAEDFNFGALHTPVIPFQLSGYQFINPTRSATIRIDTRNTQEALTALEKLWAQFSPEQAMEYQFVDEAMARYYDSERLTSKLFIIFSGLGIAICCLGLFGLMGYVVDKRSKEIGVRKVMGARISQIVMLLSKDYIRLVVISSFIAIPVAWWGVSQWLETFAYRIGNSFWVFLAAGALVTVISWCTVAIYSYQAAKANPIKALRDE